VTEATRPSPWEAANQIRHERFPGSDLVFLAGSVVRGEGTSTSDLDLVVIHPKLPAAYRESFVHHGWPVEAFIHDPETLNYFFWERDRPSGIPTLASMVLEGKEIPGESELSRSLKALAQAVIHAGPEQWTEKDFQRTRYFITDVCDDLRAPRNQAELTASMCQLYGYLADFYFRSRGLWSAKKKGIPRRLAGTDTSLAEQYSRAFELGFTAHDPSLILQLAETMLEPVGGFLFAGFKDESPAGWRKPLPGK
jgi:hypothetical protein